MENNEVEVKQKSWFKESLKLTGWTVLLVITFIAFYQVLPALLVVLGHMLLLFGPTDQGPSAIDAMVFILTGLSFTSVVTYGFLNVIKRQLKHINRIRTALADRLALKFKRKRVK